MQNEKAKADLAACRVPGPKSLLATTSTLNDIAPNIFEGAVYLPGKATDLALLPPASEIGDKARNLTILRSNGLPVPDFMVLGVSLFEAWMGESLTLLDELTVKLAHDGPAGLDPICHELERLITSRPWSETFAFAIERAAHHLARETGATHLAVRWSCPDEESAGHSFAGQLESFLNVRQDSGLLAAIASCFASAFSPRSLSYRLANSLTTEHVRAAVIVQVMVDGDVSGVTSRIPIVVGTTSATRQIHDGDRVVVNGAARIALTVGFAANSDTDLDTTARENVGIASQF